jgi:bifunctional DNA-binding transcriptional regulator/antitoxin component of YhaV-PrlF toxin-antitoxin module
MRLLKSDRDGFKILLNLIFKEAAMIAAPQVNLGSLPFMNPLTTMLSSRGQVVIPKIIRDRQNLAKDTVFTVRELPEGILLSPAVGVIKKTRTLDDFIGCGSAFTKVKLTTEELCAPVTNYGDGMTNSINWDD